MQIPRLHPDTIEQVKQRADIVDVIAEHVVLRKRGQVHVGLCPFHEEKTPSFSVTPAKQMYYCFGCQAGGDTIKFLMALGKRSFSEVVLDLARRYQVPVQTLEPEQRQEFQRQLSLREQLYEILAVATSFYQHALRQPEGQQALEYLKKTRHLREETIQQFQLGYAPVGWEILYRYLVEAKRYPLQLVEQAGLILPRKSGDGYIDRFRSRLMIPIHDTPGRIIGFGGRSLGDEQPKYLNSPETELFDKSKTLFALDKASDAISKQDRAVVVEGYFDAIALHACGITNVVASLGTALSLDQVRQLLRYTDSKQIILNFDADAAGDKAAFRAISEVARLAYTGQLQLRILKLPDGKDADEFIHTIATPEKYRELLETAPLWLDWQIQQVLLGKDLKQGDQFLEVVGAIVKLLSNITNDQTLTHYIKYCAEQLSQSDFRQMRVVTENLQNQVASYWEELLKQDNSQPMPQLIKSILKRKSQLLYKRQENQQSKRPQTDLAVSDARYRLEQAEALLLLIYLHFPEHRQKIYNIFETEYIKDFQLCFSLSHHRFLWQRILEIEGESQPDRLISLLQDRSIQYPVEMAQVAHLFHIDEKTEKEILRRPLVIQVAVANMEQVMWEKLRSKYLQEYKKLDITTVREHKNPCIEAFYKADRRIRELETERLFPLSEVIQLPLI